MKFLDENIVLSFSNLVVSQSATYPFIVKQGATTIFSGNMYLASGQTSASIDVTDIIANQKFSSKSLESNFVSTHSEAVNEANVYSATLTIGNSTYNSNSELVFLIYRYPNHKGAMVDDIIYDYRSQTGWFRLMLQGNNTSELVGGQNWSRPRLVPRIPYKDTEEYGLVMHNLFSNSLNNAEFTTYVRGCICPDFNYRFNAVSPITQSVISLGTLFGGSTDAVALIPDSEIASGNITKAGNYFIASVTAGSTVTLTAQVNYNTIAIKPIAVGETKFDIRFDGVELNADSIVFTLKQGTLTKGYIYINDTDFNTKGFIHYQIIAERTSDGHLQMHSSKLEAGSVGDTDTRVVLAGDGYSIPEGGDRVANIDMCPAHYYLMWQDRFGSFQSQPFGKTETYKESFERNTFSTYKNEQRLGSINIQPKWNVNSDWISEEFFPYYESIMVSPYLLLYDTVEDKSYRVTVSDSSYTEKTFANQNKLFNLGLELSLDKKQAIMY